MFGMTVTDIQKRLFSSEFIAWEHYFFLKDTTAFNRSDHYFAQITYWLFSLFNLIGNFMGAKNKNAHAHKTLNDFILNFEQSDQKKNSRRMTLEESKALQEGLAASFGMETQRSQRN